MLPPKISVFLSDDDNYVYTSCFQTPISRSFSEHEGDEDGAAFYYSKRELFTLKDAVRSFYLREAISKYLNSAFLAPPEWVLSKFSSTLHTLCIFERAKTIRSSVCFESVGERGKRRWRVGEMKIKTRVGRPRRRLHFLPHESFDKLCRDFPS